MQLLRKLRISIYCALIALTALPILTAIAQDSRQEETQDNRTANSSQPVYILDMKTAVGPAYTEYLQKGLLEADKNNAQLVIIKLNTPGGLLTSTRDIVSEIIQSPVPVVAWVTPSGAHAASAGTFLLYAAHIAVMDEGTNIGAATPINPGQKDFEQNTDTNEDDKKEDPKKTTDSQLDLIRKFAANPNSAGEAKALEDTLAFMRSIAEMRGRNPEWAQKAIKNAESITAQEALTQNVINFIATNEAQIFEKLDQQSITVKNGLNLQLNLSNPRIINYVPDIRILFLSYITDPNIAFLLMTIGFYGLILEFYHPGSMIGGTIGGICLVLGLFAMNVLPVNATGLALILLAFALIAAEMFVPSFGILGIGGIAALIFGSAILFDTSSVPGFGIDPELIYGMAFTGVLLIMGLVYLTRQAYKNKPSTGEESIIDEIATVIEWKGMKGRVMLQGEPWKAQSMRKLDVKKDDAVRVTALNKLTLIVTDYKPEP